MKPEALRVHENEDPPEGWDPFVRRSAGATFCHLAGWQGVMEGVLGHRTRWLVAERGRAWEGVLPLVRVSSRLFGDYLISMPFLNDGGPLGSDEARAALGRAAVERARDESVDLLELRVRTAVPDLVPSHRKITVMLDLPDDPETAWTGLKGKVRSQVRRPGKVGMVFREGAGHLDAFYRVFTRNMRDLGTPVLPRAFFEEVRDALGAEVVFGTVYSGEEPVAAGCGFAFGDEFEITWASSLRQYNRHAPNMLLYWSLIERAIERGIRRFNFGRCTPGGGTHRFKSQWGGRDVPLPWAEWSPSGVGATPSPEGPVFQMAGRAWSRLPLSVANRLGPLLARRLP